MTRATRPDALGADPALPGLATLFDTDKLRAAIAEAGLESGAPEPASVTLDYLRYKPRESAIASGRAAFPHGDVLFSLRLLKEERLAAAAPLDVPLPSDGEDRPSLAPFAAIPDLGAALFRFPLDPILRGLRHAASIDEMKRAATAIWRARGDEAIRFRAFDATIAPVRFKAGRRAVLRTSLKWKRDGDGGKGRAVFFARVSGEPARERFERNLAFHRAAAAAGVRTPEPLGAAPELDSILEESILATAAVSAAPRDLGLAAARLHGAAVPSAGGLRAIDEALLDAVAAEAVAAVLPRLAARARSLAEAIARRRLETKGADAAPRLLHGDLALEQAIVGEDGRLALLDLDRAAVGPAAADMGEAIARFRAGAATGDASKRSADEAAAAEDAFLAGYAAAAAVPARPALEARIASSLLRRVVHPLRCFRPLFRSEAESILAAAEAIS